LTTCISQGSAATDLRGGGSFNSVFIRKSFLNLIVKNYENWSTFVEVIARQNWPENFDTPCRHCCWAYCLTELTTFKAAFAIMSRDRIDLTDLLSDYNFWTVSYSKCSV